MNRNAAPDPSPKNDPKNDRMALACPITGLRKRKAVRIVGQPNGPVKPGFEIFSERAVIKTQGV